MMLYQKASDNHPGGFAQKGAQSASFGPRTDGLPAGPIWGPSLPAAAPAAETGILCKAHPGCERFRRLSGRVGRS